MVLIPIEVNGEETTCYCDGILYNKLQNKVKENVLKRDNDALYILDGSEGSGKSVFAMQLAKFLDPTFCLERVCFTPEEFEEAVKTSKKGQAIVYDEAFRGLSSRATLSKINKVLVSMMMEMRQRNLFVFVVLPTVYLLDKYVVLFRSKGLFNVYTRNGRRGYWKYYNSKRKKSLYLKNYKTYTYYKVRPLYMGRFTNTYVIDEQEYRNKKSHALTYKPKKIMEDKAKNFYNRKDEIFKQLRERYDIQVKDMAEIFDTPPDTINNAFRTSKKRNIHQDV